jgi:hypothetical protein
VKSYAALGALAVGSIGIMTTPWLLGFGAMPALWQVPNWLNTIRRATHIIVKLPAGMGQEVDLKRKHVEKIELEAEKYGWVLKVPHTHGTLLLRGDDAIRTAARVLPHRNNHGGSEREVALAVQEIERAVTANELFHAVALRTSAYRQTGLRDGGITASYAQFLALEMVAHEEQERRALEGELAELETMWREAEELAAISDNLLLPSSVKDLFRRHKEGQTID